MVDLRAAADPGAPAPPVALHPSSPVGHNCGTDRGGGGGGGGGGRGAPVGPIAAAEGAVGVPAASAPRPALPHVAQDVCGGADRSGDVPPPETVDARVTGTVVTTEAGAEDVSRGGEVGRGKRRVALVSDDQEEFPW